jgi:hypothetical protein
LLLEASREVDGSLLDWAFSLSTALGPLDPLCVLHDGRDYDDLLPHTIVLRDGPSEIRVLDLETLIAVKTAAGRARDKLVVPILLALRDRGTGKE